MSKENIHPFWRMASIVTFGGLRTRVRTREKVIYLTFDDGPHPQHTPQVLKLLRRFHAQACFFLVGNECLNHEPIVREIIGDGHRIGNHSQSHPVIDRLPVRSQWREFSQADRILSSVSNGMSRFAVRPPRGKITLSSVIYSLINKRRLYLWSRDSLDGVLASVDVCNVLRRNPVRSGDVLLFHDDSANCIEVLDAMLPEWTRSGFRFVA